MKAGDKLICPHCGEPTVLKSKPKMEGWNRVGDVLVCALCGAEAGTPDAENSGGPSASTAALAALLGETSEPKLRLDPGSEHRRFCRNCRNRIEHPFVLRCGRDGSAVDPGNSCEHFIDEEKRP